MSTCRPAGPVRPPVRMSRSRWRRAPGGGISPRIWPRPALRASGRAGGYRVRPRPQAARQDRQDRLPAPADAAGRGSAPGMLVPARPHPGMPGAARAVSRPAGRAHRLGQRIHAVLFHHGAPALGEGTLRTGQGLAELRAAAAARLSPAGQLQVATALDVIEGLEARMHEVRHQLLRCGPAPDRRQGPGRAPVRVGPGHRPAIHLLAGRAGRFSSPARRSGSPGWTSPSGPRTRTGPPWAAVPGTGLPVLRWALYEACKTHARASAPDHRLLRPGQGPLQRQARRAVRGPQDPPPGLPHPGRARAPSPPAA